MNMMSLVAGFVGVPLLCWLVFGVLPGGAERAAALQKLNLSNIELAAMTLGINLVVFRNLSLPVPQQKALLEGDHRADAADWQRRRYKGQRAGP